MYPDNPKQRVSHETIYHTLYDAMPRGKLRRELIACLRWRRDKRHSKTRTPSGYGHIIAMQSIHLRPPEVADHLIPGHWEADMIKGAMNRSSVGTRVERTTLLVVLWPRCPMARHNQLWTVSVKRSVQFPLNYAKPSPTTRGVR